MIKRVFIVHQWMGRPTSDWYPWVKNQLEQKAYQVHVLEMPDPDHPKIEDWVGKVSQEVGKLEHTDIFVTHSIGGKTVLKFLENQDYKCDKVIMVAPWLVLTPEATPDDEDKVIIKPWLETPIDFEKVKTKANSFTCIFSDNDPYVPMKENNALFNEKLGVNTIIEKDKGHLTEDDNVTELPIIIKLLSV